MIYLKLRAVLVAMLC